MKKTIFIAFIIGWFLLPTFGQTRLRRPCAASSTPATIEIQRDGDIALTPCSGRSVAFAGSFDSVFDWNGTTYTFNNTSGNAEFIMELTPDSSAGRFRVGDYTTTVGHQIDINQSASTSVIGNPLTGDQLSITSSVSHLSSATEVRVGPSASGLRAIVSGDRLRTTLAEWDLSAVGGAGFGVTSFLLNRTVTAGGTTGNQTINLPAGSVNFAAGTAAITVTNSTVSATSLIFSMAQTNDATCDVKNVVPAAGSFVINMTANCTAETRVAFWVTN